jgi:hypothetical protein
MTLVTLRLASDPSGRAETAAPAQLTGAAVSDSDVMSLLSAAALLGPVADALNQAADNAADGRAK